MVIRKDSEQTNYTCLKVHSDIEMKEEREKKKKKRERERERERVNSNHVKVESR